jgi:hypothetical protein
MYIKYEASKGSHSFAENNDLDALISSIRLFYNKLEMLISLWKISYNTLARGPFDSKYLVFEYFSHTILGYFIS